MGDKQPKPSKEYTRLPAARAKEYNRPPATRTTHGPSGIVPTMGPPEHVSFTINDTANAYWNIRLDEASKHVPWTRSASESA